MNFQKLKNHLNILCLAIILFSSHVFSYPIFYPTHFEMFEFANSKIKTQHLRYLPQKVTCFNASSYFSKWKVNPDNFILPFRDPIVDWPSMIRNCLNAKDIVGDWISLTQDTAYLIHLSISSNDTLNLKIYERNLTVENSDYMLTQSGLLFEKNSYFEGYTYKPSLKSYKKVILYRFGNKVKIRLYSKSNEELELTQL